MVKTATISLDSCRKIFVERDYSDGIIVKFVKDFPPTLEGIISHENWTETIEKINSHFANAEKVCLGSIVESTLGLCTCYISRLFIKTEYQKELVKLRAYIENQNRNIFLPVGLCIADPMERGLRIIEVNILSTGKLCAPTPSPPISNQKHMRIGVEQV